MIDEEENSNSNEYSNDNGNDEDDDEEEGKFQRKYHLPLRHQKNSLEKIFKIDPFPSSDNF